MKLSRVLFCAQIYFAIAHGGVTVQREADGDVNIEKEDETYRSDQEDAGNKNLPSFKWDGKKNGFERLIIIFPDGGKNDVALLRHSTSIPKPPEIDDDGCTYFGHLEDDSDAISAVNGCPGSTSFDISLVSNRLEYELFEVREGIVSLPPPMSDDQMPTTDVITDNTNDRDDTTVVNSRQLPSSMKLTVALLYDDKWTAKFGDRWWTRMNSALNLAKTWFEHPTLDVKIDVDVIETKYIPGDFKTGHDSTYAELATARTMINGEYGSSNADVFIIMTADSSYNSGGVAAQIGSVCKKEKGVRVGIVEGSNDVWTALMFAHETGHLLGMAHTFATTGHSRGNCDGPYVMSYSWSQSSEDKWSTCGNTDFRNYVNGKGKQQGGRFCLQAGAAPCVDTYSGDCTKYVWACTSADYPWFKDACKKTCQICASSNDCTDNSNDCGTWSSKTWFTRWCSGDYKDQTANGYFGGTTLGEACKKSCNLCG